MSDVLIVAPPAGQAPLWVRQAWVGLRLPTVTGRAQTYPVSGVLDSRPGLINWLLQWLPGRRFTMHGYEVPSARAIAILEKVAPEAAAWWWDNTPAFLHPDGTFVFEEEVCRPDRNPQ